MFVTVSSISDESRRKIRKQKFIRLRLVIMKEVDGKWVVIEDFPFNNDEYHYAHPAISVTGDTLVFSSDMKVVMAIPIFICQSEKPDNGMYPKILVRK
ncbi:MAG: hypothetical protein IPF54_23490 [Draconibacterium sp.]|nr:hypothetical protein [Draconibacterium sp.]